MKIDRLLAITVLLLNRQRISAKELATRFEVSTKTIYRDIDTLSQAGIPIVAHQGTTGGFEIMEQYTIARQFLTLSEIDAMISAVKGMTTVFNDQMFATLLDKVQALLRPADRMQTPIQSAGIVFDFNPWGQNPATRNKVNLLREAITHTYKVHLHYLNTNGIESERTVEPSALILKGYVWYLHAYCTLRKEFRLFRLSRILELECTQDSFTPRAIPDWDQYQWNNSTTYEEQRQNVTLLFSAQVRYRLNDMFDPDWIIVQSDGRIEVRGAFIIDDWFYNMVLSFGDQVRIQSPSALIPELMGRAQKVIDSYSN